MQDLINLIRFYDYAIKSVNNYHELCEWRHLRRLAIKMLRDLVE